MKLDPKAVEIAVSKITEQDELLVNALYATKTYEHKVAGSFTYIPFVYYEEIYGLLDFLTNRMEKIPTILDVGAGTGRMVKIFKDFGFPAAGIEFHQPYVDAGRRFFELSEQELILQDAFTLTSEFLAGFDVIYTYMPICNRNRMTELHAHLYSHAKPGAFLVEMLPNYYPLNSLNKLSEHKGTEFFVVRKPKFY